MKSTITRLSLIVLIFIATIVACKKEQSISNPELDRLIRTYDLKPTTSTARPEFTFASVHEAEIYLKGRFKSETTAPPTKVLRYIAKAKDGSYTWDSELRNKTCSIK